ncbi:MAG: DUF58 domain-containing protein [Planctomycetota bacterium]|nr:DUF58 domain-containing protein [Planctomycetota bacterium]
MPEIRHLVFAVDALVVGVVVVDLLLGLPRRSHFKVERSFVGTWSHNRQERVRFHIDHHSVLPRRVTVVPDLMAALVTEMGAQVLSLPPRRRASVVFAVTATERGVFEFGALWIAAHSRLGLWRRHMRFGESTPLHVYPNLKQLSEYALLARTNRLSLIGVRRFRRAGGDTEFERLRDYQTGDPLQRVDWKATARRQALTVRDFQVSQSQNVIFMLDTGRMMASRHEAEGGEISLLDQAIDAALMMAYVALAQGDRVGLIAYSDSVHRYVPPKGGARHLNQLIHAVHDLQPQLVESRHDEAFLYLQRKERKRCMACLFTSIIDQVNADVIQAHVTKLHGRHLPMTVVLRDPGLHVYLDKPPVGEDALYRSGAAAMIANWREEALRSLGTAGALVVDSAADELTPAVVSRYLEVKARHLL